MPLPSHGHHPWPAQDAKDAPEAAGQIPDQVKHMNRHNGLKGLSGEGKEDGVPLDETGRSPLPRFLFQ